MPLPLFSLTEHPLQDLFEKYSKPVIKVTKSGPYTSVSHADPTIVAIKADIEKMGLIPDVTPTPHKGPGLQGDNIVRVMVEKDASKQYHIVSVYPQSNNLRGLS